MADLHISKLENELREHVSHFVNETLFRSPASPVLKLIKQNKWPSFLCGGAIRDLLLAGRHVLPRDLDIIVHYVTKEELKEKLSLFDFRENRFGGLSIQISDWKVDIWPLASTWAFLNDYVEYDSSFSSFTKTTFLNIEAIVVELFSERGRKRTVYSNGFFEAIRNRVLEINLEPNPSPQINVARAIYMSLRYQFAFGPNLQKYIKKHIDVIDKKWLLDVYRNNYSLLGWNEDSLNVIVEKVKNEHGAIEEDLRHSRTKEDCQSCLF